MDARGALTRIALIITIGCPPAYCVVSVPESGVLVECTFVEESRGRGKSPGSVEQTEAVLLVRSVNSLEEAEEGAATSDLTLPPHLNPGMVLDVFDDSGVLAYAGFVRPPGSSEKLACELNRYLPQEGGVNWASELAPDQRTPAYRAHHWLSSHIEASDGSLSAASLHRVVSGPRGEVGPQGEGGNEGESGADHEEWPTPHRTSVVLNVFSRVRYVRARLGRAVRLDCGFTLERAMPVAVEWRYQHQGSGRLVYAYSAAQDRVHAAQEGAYMQLDLLHSHSNASLLLQNVQLQHEGTYICAVYIPGLQAQIPVTLEIAEPPNVVLTPTPLYLSAGQSQDVACEVSGYYPLDVTVTWWQQAAGDASVRPLPGSWQLGHQRNADGTFNVTSGVHVRPGAADHGAVYTCHVEHLSVTGGVRRNITLMVAGASGPKVEDAMGLLLCAFTLYGALKVFQQWLFPHVTLPRANTEEELKKSN